MIIFFRIFFCNHCQRVITSSQNSLNLLVYTGDFMILRNIWGDIKIHNSDIFPFILIMSSILRMKETAKFQCSIYAKTREVKTCAARPHVTWIRELSQNFVMIRRLASLNRIVAISLRRCIWNWLALVMCSCLRLVLSSLFSFAHISLRRAPEECHKGVNALSPRQSIRRQCATPGRALLWFFSDVSTYDTIVWGF